MIHPELLRIITIFTQQCHIAKSNKDKRRMRFWKLSLYAIKHHNGKWLSSVEKELEKMITGIV